MVLKAYEKTKKKEEAKPTAPKGPSSEDLLTEIRDLLANKNKSLANKYLY